MDVEPLLQEQSTSVIHVHIQQQIDSELSLFLRVVHRNSKIACYRFIFEVHKNWESKYTLLVAGVSLSCSTMSLVSIHLLSSHCHGASHSTLSTVVNQQQQ